MSGLWTRRTRLRPIAEEDYPELTRWRNDMGELPLWSSMRSAVSPDAYRDELKNDYHEGIVRFAVERTRDGALIGQVFSYGHSPINRHAFVAIYIDRSSRRSFYAADALALLTRYLFENIGLHKIYFDVFGFNELSQAVLEKLNARCEGKFGEHIFYKQQYWAMRRFAIYAVDISDHTRLLNRLLVG